MGFKGALINNNGFFFFFAPNRQEFQPHARQDLPYAIRTNLDNLSDK